jgi:hypothetical protein
MARDAERLGKPQRLDAYVQLQLRPSVVGTEADDVERQDDPQQDGRSKQHHDRPVFENQPRFSSQA